MSYYYELNFREFVTETLHILRKWNCDIFLSLNGSELIATAENDW